MCHFVFLLGKIAHLNCCPESFGIYFSWCNPFRWASHWFILSQRTANLVLVNPKCVTYAQPIWLQWWCHRGHGAFPPPPPKYFFPSISLSPTKIITIMLKLDQMTRFEYFSIKMEKRTNFCALCAYFFTFSPPLEFSLAPPLCPPKFCCGYRHCLSTLNRSRCRIMDVKEHCYFDRGPGQNLKDLWKLKLFDSPQLFGPPFLSCLNFVQKETMWSLILYIVYTCVSMYVCSMW